MFNNNNIRYEKETIGRMLRLYCRLKHHTQVPPSFCSHY